MEDKEMKYEDALAKLEKLIIKIEDPSRPLTKISEDVKTAAALIEFCRKKLREDEESMSKILNFESK